MDSEQIQAALDEVFDQAIVFSATHYMRDYEIITYSTADPRTGIEPAYDRYLFTHCVEAQVGTALMPTIWSRARWTAQKHDYPGTAWRRSYGRRTGAERTFSTIKGSATTDTTRGWCRLTGLTAITLFLTSAMVVRNVRIVDAFEARQADDTRPAAAGRPRATRRRRRRTLADLVDTV